MLRMQVRGFSHSEFFQAPEERPVKQVAIASANLLILARRGVKGGFRRGEAKEVRQTVALQAKP
jgi:ABC-type uncharacterized transport system ATPase component